jgi:hypothetical protein
VLFEIQHDGQTHDYSIEFEAKNKMLAVRLDPGQAPGDVRILSMTLHNADDLPVKDWQFGKDPSPK